MDIFLQSFGSKLRVKDGLFEVRHFGPEGNHTEQTLQHFSPKELKTVWLKNGTSISADAVLLAEEHNIDIVITDYFGNAKSRIKSVKPQNNIALIQKAQLKAALDNSGLLYAKQWLQIKSWRQIELLQKLYASKGLETPTDLINKITQAVERLNTDQNPESIRGIEGSAANIYWKGLSQLLSEKDRFATRNRQPAQDYFNSALNYAYGILYSKVENALHLAGLNPYIGFLHRDGHQFKALLYDFIEPYRPWADETVYKLFSQKKLGDKHFQKLESNGFWLSNEGKKVLAPALLGFLQKNISETPDAPKISRLNFIKNDASGFAKNLVQGSK